MEIFIACMVVFIAIKLEEICRILKGKKEKKSQNKNEEESRHS